MTEHERPQYNSDFGKSITKAQLEANTVMV